MDGETGFVNCLAWQSARQLCYSRQVMSAVTGVPENPLAEDNPYVNQRNRPVDLLKQGEQNEQASMLAIHKITST